jgi:carbon-monoxide dehydrogenase medium subunit
VRDTLPALAEAARCIGALQTRNLGTVGGNLMACVPCMDSGPLLLALDACATVAHPGGVRRLLVADLLVGPRRTSLRFDELLVEVVVPRRHFHKPSAFLKFGLRKGQALALVNVGATLWLDRGTLREPTIALGAVAPTVMRAREAEAFLEGTAAGPATFAEAGRLAAREAEPITDFRASAAYRRDLVAVLTARALQAACARAAQPRDAAA